MSSLVLSRPRTADSLGLRYVGVNKHKGEDVGLYDTVLSATEQARF
jgi:hypothetical protein